MSSSKWHDKFSSIVKETETNLERVKQRMSSSRSERDLSLSLRDNDRSIVPTRMAHSTSSDYPVTLFYGAPTLPSRDGGGEVGITTRMAYDTQLSHNMIEDQAQNAIHYVPLHQSTAVIALLHDKINAQSKTIEELSNRLERNEKEMDSFLKQLHDLKNEMRRLQTTPSSSDRGFESFAVEQTLDKMRHETKKELELMMQKYNYLKNRNEETAVAMDTKNGSLSNTFVDLQKFVRSEMNALKGEVDSLNSRICKLESNMTLQMKATTMVGYDKPVQLDPWTTAREEKEKYDFGRNTVSFFPDSERSNDRAGKDGNQQLVELKNNLRELQRKLLTLETDILPDSDFTDADLRRRKRKPKSILAKTTLSPSTSDLDISTATDLVTCSYTVNGLTLDSEANLSLGDEFSSDGDDLTLEDLS